MKKERSGKQEWEEEEEKEKKEGKETSSIRFTFFVCYGLMFMVSMPQIYTLKSTQNADINLCYIENPGGWGNRLCKVPSTVLAPHRHLKRENPVALMLPHLILLVCYHRLPQILMRLIRWENCLPPQAAHSILNKLQIPWINSIRGFISLGYDSSAQTGKNSNIPLPCAARPPSAPGILT